MKAEYKFLLILFIALILAVPMSRPKSYVSSSHTVDKKSLPVNSVVQPPAIAPAPIQPVSGNCESYLPLIDKYNWDTHVAMAIMQAESGCREVTPSNAAINYDGISDFGLFQLHGIAVTDPAENIRIAYQVKYLHQGWGAWSTYNDGEYRQFLR